MEFTREFATEEQCFEYLVRCRWPEGFRCRRCGHDRSWPRPDRQALRCAKCDLITSVTAGTVMHRSRQPLRAWVLGAYLVATDKRGISALQLQRQLGLSRYETAFQMLHKLRAAMVAPDRSKLYGAVEVDECYIGAPPRNREPRDALEKLIVAGAVEVRPGSKKGATRPGRIRLRHLAARSKLELVGFVMDNVEPGALVITDGLGSYKDVKLAGYERAVESTADGMKQRDVLRHFHLVVSNLKAWLHGTLHGGISGKHLQAYLNEYAFRVNRRGTPQAAFQTILGIAANVRGPTYDQLYADAGEPDGWEHPGLLGSGRSTELPFDPKP